MRFDPTNAMVVIYAWPKPAMVSFALGRWLAGLGFGFDNPRVICLTRHDIHAAYNSGVAVALGYHARLKRQPFEQFIFVDNDMEPGSQTAEFLRAEQDVVSAMYPTGHAESWDHPYAFHTGLWRTHRKVLETIRPPWFGYKYSEDGCSIVACSCAMFRNKAVAAGFTVGHAGWAGHKPRT